MKFTVETSNKTVFFEDIKVGETFIDADRAAFFEDEILMRIATSGGDCEVDFDPDYNYVGAAINLTTGDIYAYHDDNEVYRVECGPILVKYL